MHITILVGSFRQNSYNQQLATLVKSLTPKEITISQISIANLPLYSQDLDDQLPQSVQDFKQAISQADGVLIVTPEYNRSIPGALKNAIDWASRPTKESVWTNKPVGIMGASTGQFGTITAQFDLRRILTHVQCQIMPQPQVYVAKVEDKLDNDTFEPKTVKAVTRFMDAYIEWVRQHSQQM